MPEFAVTMERVVLVRQGAYVVVDATDEATAREEAFEADFRWVDHKIINSEGIEILDIKAL